MNLLNWLIEETVIYTGFLLLANYPLYKGSPILHKNIKLGAFLVQFNQINGHSFILDERLRGTGLDKKMLLFKKKFIDQYDFIWIAVERDLGTHNYWKRLGFKEIFKINEATFYIMANDKISNNIENFVKLENVSYL